MKDFVQGWRISYKDEGWSTKDEGWSVNKRESINTTVVGSKFSTDIYIDIVQLVHIITSVSH